MYWTCQNAQKYATGQTVAGVWIFLLSAIGQKIFHTGYELREINRHDIRNIDNLPKQKDNI